MAEEIVQFVPFTSFVNPSFWHKLAELKIDVDRLDDVARTISGFFSITTDTSGAPAKLLLEVDYTAFSRWVKDRVGIHLADSLVLQRIRGTLSLLSSSGNDLQQKHNRGFPGMR